MTIDEEKIKEEFKAIFERFEKLEKKVDDLGIKSINNKFTWIGERFVELKKKLYKRHSDLAKVVKKEIAELKEEIKIIQIGGRLLQDELDIATDVLRTKCRIFRIEKIEKVLREFHKEFYDIISIIAKDEWDSDTSANLRTHRDRIKRTFKQLNVDSIHDDPLIKKYQEKFQEIKDGSKSADSGGILGGAKKKRNIDLKADEEPLELYELYMKDKEQYNFRKTTHPFIELNNMVNLGMGEIRVLRADLEEMILELRNNIYGFDKEEWFTNIEKQIGYDYKKDLKRILEERKHIRDEKKE